jgi:hypothetical protein
MNSEIDRKWQDSIRNMPPEEKEAFLRAIFWLRVHCPQCLVKEPQLDRQPCASCISPGVYMQRPVSSLN